MTHLIQPAEITYTIKNQHSLQQFLKPFNFKISTEEEVLIVDISLGVKHFSFQLPAEFEDSDHILAYKIIEELLCRFFSVDSLKATKGHTKNGYILQPNLACETLDHKISAGYICQSCINKLLTSRSYSVASITLLSTIIDALETLRKSFCGVSFRPIWSDYRLRIDRHREIVLQLDNQIIPLNIGNGWGKAFYFLLLKNPHGLKVKEFEEGENKEQLIRFYLLTKNWDYSSCSRQIESWKTEGQFGDICSSILNRIRTKLEKQLNKYPHLLQQLSISRSKGAKQILIDRKLIDFELPDLLEMIHGQAA